MPSLAQPRVPAPPGACDTHMHIFTPGYLMLPGTNIPAQNGSLERYRQMQRRLGLTRTVIVQPTAYGTDNTVTLNAMAELGNARGVAVIDAAVRDSELERLTQSGMRGLRFHMLPGGALKWHALEPMAARVASFGWHVQFQFDATEFTAHAARLARLPCDIVIDHIGRFAAPIDFDDPNVRAMRGLIDGGHCWIKLSAPYHGSRAGPPHYTDVSKLAVALIAQAPERMLWASNWPHPSLKQNFPDEAALLDLLAGWAPDSATREKILVGNPGRLYGF
ncbi:MAG TPA: amidohydrolase family protein [Burkholderiales bacterium]|nr:amidohydrolase family protein [Burkholderiales bacterium]